MNNIIYAKNIRQAVDFIEANIKKRPDYSLAAEAAGMSKDNFWRVFKKLFNETIGNYIRARKLTLIARRLTSSREKISDIAFEYGYESPEIFTRAFKKRFFTNPAQYRENGKNMYFYERQKLTEKSIRHYLTGGINLSPGIVKIRSFDITGLKFRIPMKRAVHAAISAVVTFLKASKKLFARGEKKFYVYLTSIEGNDLNAFSTDGAIDVIGGNFVERQIPGFIRKKVPAGKYALFMHRGGLDKILTSYEYIFDKWLRRKMKARNRGYFFEIIHRGPPLSSKFEIEIYVPLK